MGVLFAIPLRVFSNVVNIHTTRVRNCHEPSEQVRELMSLIARFIIDTSAATHMSHPEVKRRVRALLDGSVVGTTASLDAVAFAGTPARTDYERLLAYHRATREYLPTNDEHWHTALGAQRALAKTGEHGTVDIMDLLTAVIASVHKLTIIHYSAGFEAASSVLTFRHRWVMPPGSL